MPAVRGKHQIADPLTQGNAAGLAGEEDRVVGVTQGRGESRGLRGLARAFDALQRQEDAGRTAGPSLRQALRFAARLSPLRGALARLGAAAFDGVRAFLWPYFAMKSSTICRATSSGY